MKAVQIVELNGPDSALAVVDIPEPGPSHMLTPGDGVVIDVHAAGVAFPEVLQTRGGYQIKPPLPFVPGSEVAGTVRRAPEDAGVRKGDGVAAFCLLGGFAEVATAPRFLTFRLPDALDYAQGASLILNYHTAYFALKTARAPARGRDSARARRGRGRGHGGASGRQTLGARTIAVVSTDDKERVARAAGADEVVRSDGPWRDQAREFSSSGVDAYSIRWAAIASLTLPPH